MCLLSHCTFDDHIVSLYVWRSYCFIVRLTIILFHCTFDDRIVSLFRSMLWSWRGTGNGIHSVNKRATAIYRGFLSRTWPLLDWLWKSRPVNKPNVCTFSFTFVCNGHHRHIIYICYSPSSTAHGEHLICSENST